MLDLAPLQDLFHSQEQIGHRVGHEANGGVDADDTVVLDSLPRQSTGGWLETGNAAERGWNPDTAPNVGANANDGAPSGYQSSLTPTGASWGPVRVQKVASASIDGVAALIGQVGLRNVGLAKGNGAKLSHHGYQSSVFCHRILQ